MNFEKALQIEIKQMLLEVLDAWIGQAKTAGSGCRKDAAEAIAIIMDLIEKSSRLAVD